MFKNCSADDKVNAFLKSLMYKNLPVVKQFEAAVSSDNTQRLLELISGGIDVNMVIQPTLKNRPLHLAAARGHSKTVSHLLRAGADPTSLNKLGLTPLFVGFITGRTRCLEILLTVDTVVKDFEIFWNNRNLSDVLWNNSKDETIAVIIKATPNLTNLRSNVAKNLIFLCERKGYHKSLDLFVRTGNLLTVKQLEELSTIQDGKFLKWFSSFVKTPQSLKHYARLVVRKSMHDANNVYFGSRTLDIPSTLVNYLCFVQE